MELQKIICWNKNVLTEEEINKLLNNEIKFIDLKNKNILTEEEIDKLLNNENIEIENLECLDEIGE